MYSTPFLLFDGNCADAMKFYQECFGGELSLTKLGDTPMKEQFPAEKHDRVINAELESGDIRFSATDWMASPELEPKQGNTTAIFLVGGSENEIKASFEKLAVGADKDTRTFIEPHEMPFGIYAQLTDKYQVSWIFRGE